MNEEFRRQLRQNMVPSQHMNPLPIPPPPPYPWSRGAVGARSLCPSSQPRPVAPINYPGSLPLPWGVPGQHQQPPQQQPQGPPPLPSAPPPAPLPPFGPMPEHLPFQGGGGNAATSVFVPSLPDTNAHTDDFILQLFRSCRRDGKMSEAGRARLRNLIRELPPPLQRKALNLLELIQVRNKLVRSGAPYESYRRYLQLMAERMKFHWDQRYGDGALNLNGKNAGYQSSYQFTGEDGTANLSRKTVQQDASRNSARVAESSHATFHGMQSNQLQVPPQNRGNFAWTSGNGHTSVPGQLNNRHHVMHSGEVPLQQENVRSYVQNAASAHPHQHGNPQCMPHLSEMSSSQKDSRHFATVSERPHGLPSHLQRGQWQVSGSEVVSPQLGERRNCAGAARGAHTSGLSKQVEAEEQQVPRLQSPALAGGGEGQSGGNNGQRRWAFHPWFPEISNDEGEPTSPDITETPCFPSDTESRESQVFNLRRRWSEEVQPSPSVPQHHMMLNPVMDSADSNPVSQPTRRPWHQPAKSRSRRSSADPYPSPKNPQIRSHSKRPHRASIDCTAQTAEVTHSSTVSGGCTDETPRGATLSQAAEAADSGRVVDDGSRLDSFAASVQKPGESKRRSSAPLQSSLSRCPVSSHLPMSSHLPVSPPPSTARKRGKAVKRSNSTPETIDLITKDGGASEDGNRVDGCQTKKPRNQETWQTQGFSGTCETPVSRTSTVPQVLSKNPLLRTLLSRRPRSRFLEVSAKHHSHPVDLPQSSQSSSSTGRNQSEAEDLSVNPSPSQITQVVSTPSPHPASSSTPSSSSRAADGDSTFSHSKSLTSACRGEQRQGRSESRDAGNLTDVPTNPTKGLENFVNALSSGKVLDKTGKSSLSEVFHRILDAQPSSACTLSFSPDARPRCSSSNSSCAASDGSCPSCPHTPSPRPVPSSSMEERSERSPDVASRESPLSFPTTHGGSGIATLSAEAPTSPRLSGFSDLTSAETRQLPNEAESYASAYAGWFNGPSETPVMNAEEFIDRILLGIGFDHDLPQEAEVSRIPRSPTGPPSEHVPPSNCSEQMVSGRKDSCRSSAVGARSCDDQVAQTESNTNAHLQADSGVHDTTFTHAGRNAGSAPVSPGDTCTENTEEPISGENATKDVCSGGEVQSEKETNDQSIIMSDSIVKKKNKSVQQNHICNARQFDGILASSVQNPKCQSEMGSSKSKVHSQDGREMASSRPKELLPPQGTSRHEEKSGGLLQCLLSEFDNTSSMSNGKVDSSESLSVSPTVVQKPQSSSMENDDMETYPTNTRASPSLEKPGSQNGINTEVPHSNKMTPFTCNTCGKRFKVRPYYKLHVISHEVLEAHRRREHSRDVDSEPEDDCHESIASIDSSESMPASPPVTLNPQSSDEENADTEADSDCGRASPSSESHWNQEPAEDVDSQPEDSWHKPITSTQGSGEEVSEGLEDGSKTVQAKIWMPLGGKKQDHADGSENGALNQKLAGHERSKEQYLTSCNGTENEAVQQCADDGKSAEADETDGGHESSPEGASEGTFYCSECQCLIKGTSYAFHESHVHPLGKQRTNFSCYMCRKNKNFPSETLLKKHIWKLHSNDVECEECLASFSHPLFLNDHIEKMHVSPLATEC